MEYVKAMLSRNERERFASILKKAGLKATRARLALLSALEKAKDPITASDIAVELKNGPDQATIYRALKELKDTKIIRQIDFGHGHAHYELAGHTDHHHLICTNCHKIENFTGCNFESIVKSALKQSKEFKSITQHSLELFGICKSCARK